MDKIKTSAELKIAIQQLEYLQDTHLILLKEKYNSMCEGFKPVNIIKNTIKDITTSPDLKSDLSMAAVGITSGIIVKKILLGKTNNPLTKLMGFMVEMFVTKQVAKNADKIKAFGATVIEKLSGNKESEDGI